jgi:pyruvate dehydrogenase E1 component
LANEYQPTVSFADPTNGIEVLETREWLDSLDYVLSHGGPERAGRLLQHLALHARREAGINLPFSATTPYQNTIPSRQQPPFPGSQEMERRIKSLVRWNAMAMVVRANKIQEGIGGHISTFASAATLYEVAFNHFFQASTESGDRDVVYFQGHAAPGIYARAYLEGRIPKEKLENFRRELKPGGGLSSYPHPWLMPDFWEFPTVSMGLGPIQAIYHARFIKYLENRGLKTTRPAAKSGRSGRRRNGRTGIAGLDHAGFARAARQPDLRRQLQPAAARRPGARQRQDHSGTGSRFSAARAGTSSR